MPRYFYLSALVAALAAVATPAVAQQLAARPTASFSPSAAELVDAGRQCAEAHVRTAKREATSSVSHRQKMDRYDVKYYKLDLALTNTSLDVAGSVWMRVRVRGQALDSLAFELYQAPVGSPAGTATLLIDSVVVNGRRAPGIRRAGNDVTARLAVPAAANTLADARIYYHGTAPSGNSAAIGGGFNRATQFRMGGTTYPYNVVWSLSEPYAAHEWFPCKQVLTDKADSSDVWVTTALPNKVGSNGVLNRTVTLPNNQVRYEWKSRYPIDYYLISVAVAPYIESVSYANPAGGPVVPIVDYVYNQAALTYYQTEINRTAGFIENYSSLVGLYPFANEKYGHSTAPIGGGMEHQTMTTQDGYEFTLTAHELFHQWFGDNVTCASWEDIWLNESFASYGEYLSLQRFSTPANARGWMDNAHAYAFQSPTGSIYVADTMNVGRIFSYRLTYKKGAAVVHMLRYLLNDDTKFFRALRTYQTQYRGSTAHTADLQRIFEAEAGRSLSYFFQQWFRGEGFPRFAVRWNQGGGTFVLQADETAATPTATPFFDTDVSYLLTFADGSTRTVRLRQDQASKTFSFPVAGTVVSVAVDPEQWILDNSPAPVQDTQLLASATAATVLPLTFYPNPCRETLQLADLPAASATAEAVDATGRRVLRQTVRLGQAQLNTQALAPGLYHLRLLGTHGELLGQSRFVRE